MKEEIIEIADILLKATQQNGKNADMLTAYTAFDNDTIWEYGCDRLNCAVALYKAGYRRKEEREKEK